VKWRAIKQIATATTTRLAATYIVIIMLMSIGFSIVFYNASSHQLGRQLPPQSVYDREGLALQQAFGVPGQNTGSTPQALAFHHESIDDFLQKRINEGRHALLIRLLWLNALALIGGTALSYYLARRTLAPIEEAMEAQRQFVSDASHELRTPLTALQTTNEVALRKPKLSTKEMHELLQYNVAEAVKLKALSDALLGLLKNEGHAPRLTSVSLQDAVADAMNQIVRLALDKKIAVHDDVPPIAVFAHPLGLSQAITILLDNAVKYSPSGSTIYLSATKKARFAYLQVRDEGIGIKASDLPHIFRRFYRADKSRTSQQMSPSGYGLGLAIAQKIIHSLHGSIDVESTPGSGTTFTIKLPLA
jgi:signal transduction histidine kinase